LKARNQGFTTIELLVAISVTAVLAGLLLTISTNILNTQRQSSNNLETNQIAQFVLDRIQEDLQCAVYRNDGNAWMAISILDGTEMIPTLISLNQLILNSPSGLPNLIGMMNPNLHLILTMAKGHSKTLGLALQELGLGFLPKALNKTRIQTTEEQHEPLPTR